MSAPYRGLTWDHPRGYQALRDAAQENGLITWDVHSLEGFESAPIDEICARYDLVVLDHPHLGDALATDCLLPLDEVFDADTLARIARDSIGLTYESYTQGGRQWALPLDAATQVMATRPDLLDAAPPTDWNGVLDLSARTGRVAMSLAGPHAFLSWLSIVAALRPGIDLRDGQNWPGHALATEACELLAELAARSPASVASHNPISLLAQMGEHDDVALCPLVYGYVNYSSAARPRPIVFHDAPSGPDGVPGSILGGTGIAISRRCRPDAALREHLAWLLQETTQTDFIPRHAGQPSHRHSWDADTVNADSLDFYRNTTRTLAAARIRPRFAGYIPFQSDASALLRDGMAAKLPAGELAQRLSDLYATALDISCSVTQP